MYRALMEADTQIKPTFPIMPCKFGSRGWWQKDCQPCNYLKLQHL